MNTPTSEQLDRFARVLGDQLRTARQERGWTRKQMRAEMGADDEDEVSLHTLATYELSTRRISVERLVELCAVLKQRPDTLLLRATTLAFGSDHDGRVTVDLSALAHTTDPRLQPVQRWARVRARQCPVGRTPVEELDVHALTALAGLAGSTRYELVQALRDLRGAEVPDHPADATSPCSSTNGPRVTHTSRVFEHHQIWRLTPDALREATTLLAGAILRDHHSVQHVIGIANGGVAPARMIASTLGVKALTVHARHNTGDATYQQATGRVTLDLDPLTRALNGQRLNGRVLVVDDICGSGATLRRLRHDLAPVLSPSAQLLTAVLCLNTGATTLPDYSIWTVSDWVVFPWEKPPADQDTTPLPRREEVLRHA